MKKSKKMKRIKEEKNKRKYIYLDFFAAFYCPVDVCKWDEFAIIYMCCSD